ncbi:hemiasterlin resistant protein 1-like isoform X1 [Zingiber officinale]|uniref:hemiasterlin resistant protein 1-like isoform X1 n=1 Tax=Zingiber officinale TaxID=94328 RepID=UPI001C4D93BB|nr:hemiasterlin resistant protein 1-like isoform X1 [Zingiber officinale]
MPRSKIRRRSSRSRTSGRATAPEVPVSNKPSSSGRPTVVAGPVCNPPQKERSAPPPAPAQARESPLGSFVATIKEGFGFGAGSALAHRAIEAVLGPRSIKLETVVSPAPTAPPPVNASLESDACNIHSKAFQDCVNNFGSDVSKCQFYLDVLNECRRGSGAVVSA